MLAVAHSLTSPGTKFRTGRPGAYRYHNHEAAQAVIEHVLTGNHLDAMPNAGDLSIGVYNWNLRNAEAAISQLMKGGGAGVLDIRNTAGEPLFSSLAPKVASYVGAWIEPEGPDAYFTSDIHAGHAMVPHLGVEKSTYYRLGDGREVPFLPGANVPRSATVVRVTDADGRTSVKHGRSENSQLLGGRPVVRACLA